MPFQELSDAVDRLKAEVIKALRIRDLADYLSRLIARHHH